MTPIDIFAQQAVQGLEEYPASALLYMAAPLGLACLSLLVMLWAAGWPALRDYFLERRLEALQKARRASGVVDIEHARIQRFIREERQAGRVK